MRKWALSACCAVLLISGCSGQTANEIPEDEGSVEQAEDQLIQTLLVSQGVLQTDLAGQTENGVAVNDSQLISSVAIRQLDGTAVSWTGHAITNEAIGYTIYLLPGFRAEIAEDSGTLTLSSADGSTRAVLEALPPRADLQAAADELKNTLQQWDENVLEIQDYQRLEFWSDAKIFRAYNGEDRITAMLKSVHDIPLRITVTERTDTDTLLLFMSMIHTIATDNLEALTAPREELVRELVSQAYLQQRAILTAFQAGSASAAENSTDAGSSKAPDQDVDKSIADGSTPPLAEHHVDEEKPDIADGEENSQQMAGEEMVADESLPDDTEQASPEQAEYGSVSADYSAYFTVGSRLSDILHTEASVIAYLETVYTPSAAKEMVKQLALRETESELVSDWEQPEATLQWEQATFTRISESEDTIRYLVRIPGAEGIYELREIALQKLPTGWRLQTPLDMTAREIPDTQDT